MLPAQRNKVDISKLTPAEQQAFRLYGKLPSRSVSKSQERKYFDSGDWALSKAGKQKGEYGKEIPTPDAIPHASPSPLVGASISANGGIVIGSPGSGSGGSPGSLGGISTGIASGSPPGSFSLGANAATGGGGGGSGGGTSPTSASGGISALSQAAPGGGTTAGNARSGSPPQSSALGASGNISPGLNNNNGGNNTAGASSGGNSQVSTGGSSAVSLSMSPGRVGIGGSMGVPISIGTPGSAHALATSPTRSFGSFPIAHSHSHSTHHQSYSNTTNTGTASGSISHSVGVGAPLSPPSGLSIPLPGSSGASGLGSSLSGTSPMISATTGNQVGKVQIRRASQSDHHQGAPDIGGINHAVNMASNTGSILGGTASPPPTSGLANSITPDSLMEEDDDAEEGVSREATPGGSGPGVSNNKGEDEQIEGMELQ